MGVDVVSTTVIDAPVERVAGYAGDPRNAPAWYANIASVVLLTPEPVGLGSRMAFEARFLGRRLAYTYEIVEPAPGRRLVMRTSQGPFPMETTYAWEPVDGDRTAMTLRNRGTPQGFSRLAGLVMAPAIRRANRADLRRLKALIETGAAG